MAAIMYPAYGMDSYTDTPKVQSAVMQWIESQDADTHAANADANADTTNAGTTGPATLSVYLHLDSEDSIGSLPDFIVPESSSYNIVVAFLTADQIMQASALDTVTQITIPERATPAYHGRSQGVSFMGADKMHTRGVTGDGIKVAVIDVDFFPNNPQIASNVVHAKLIDSSNDCDNDISCGERISHGTATAEIVVDMAPDVSLYLYAIGNTLDFNEAISDAMSRGVDIIQASLGFPGASPPSGKEFRNGESIVAKKVNEAEADGVTVVTSAGNDGNEYILTKYTPSRTPIPPTRISNYQSLMEFQPSAFGIQKACLPVSYYDDAWLVLVWDDHWSGATNDYDLYLYDRQMRTIIDDSTNPQHTRFHKPVEFIRVESNAHGPSDGCLVVASWSTSEDHQLRIYADAMHADKTRSGSIGTPADATGAIAVGAVDVHDNRITDYSSAGPTDDGRPKPEICGATNVLNHQYTRGYHGTSASAPHVSGLVALLMEVDPSLQGTGKDKILDILNQHARSHSSYSRANLCGPGVASLATYSGPPQPSDSFPALESRIAKLETEFATLQDSITAIYDLLQDINNRLSHLEGNLLTSSPHDDSYIKIHNHQERYTAGDTITVTIHIDSPQYVDNIATAHLDYGMFLVGGGADNTISTNSFTGAGYLGHLFGTALFGAPNAGTEFYGPGFYCNGAGTSFDLKFERTGTLENINYNGWTQDPARQGVPCIITPNTPLSYAINITDDYPTRDDYTFVIGTDPDRGFATPAFTIN